MKYTLNEFKNIWNGISANDILNQFYYEHIELQKAFERIANLQIDKSQLTNNWNELEEWVKNDKEEAMVNFECGRCFNMFDILDKMKEIKEGNNVSDRD